MLEVRSISFKDEKILSILTYTNENVWPQLVLYTDEYKSNFWLTDEEGMCLHLMQFTGLLDKNGKEIYEGDICNCKEWYFGDLKEIAFNGVVSFDDGQFAIIKETDSPYSLYQALDSCSISNRDIKVVGNIYQNPELLNK